jgi:sigma-B regulation protein RsbU (phosphoserine phosphatase)
LLSSFYIRNKPYILLLALSALMTLTLAAVPIFQNNFIKLINAIPYILWHNIFEISSIIISICIFCVSYYSFEQKQNLRYLFLGSMLFLMALIGFYHVMSYKGMPDFLVANDTANRATTFWIIARLIGGFGILVSIAMPKKSKLRLNKILFIIIPILISLVILNIVTYYPWLIPPMYIEVQGLTTTKIILEIVVICLYLFCIFFILNLYRNENDNFLITLSCALLIGVFSELSFTLYADVYGIYNFIGHFFKFIMYFIIFRVIFIKNVQQPYRDLSAAHAEIKNYANNLDKIVAQRTEEINLIHQKLLDDLEYARDIQLSMLPKTMPDMPGTVFEARYFPAERVSGDFYNIFKLNETKIGIYIGDVSGHGVPAAMLTVFLNQSIKPIKENDLGVKEILSPSVVLENIYTDFNQKDFNIQTLQ